MRPKTITAWIFVGLGLVATGMWLYIFQVIKDRELAIFLAVLGSVYVIVGGMLTVVHDWHMAKRWRSRLE
jgi:hypothetical protein